jgi:hypothetical protein
VTNWGSAIYFGRLSSLSFRDCPRENNGPRNCVVWESAIANHVIRCLAFRWNNNTFYDPMTIPDTIFVQNDIDELVGHTHGQERAVSRS